MEDFSIGSAPFLIIGVLFILFILIFFWNRKNSRTNRRLKQRSFKQEYYAKKKERELEDE